MRYLILSDMHGNWDALSSVLRHVRRKRFDATIVLGDLVGYGAAPNQVVESVRSLSGRVHSVRGNHDKVVAEIEDGSGFNEAALEAARWTTARLTGPNLHFVRQLPQGPRAIDDELTICHGSPLDEDTYVFTEYDAWEIFRDFPASLIFFGHTHVPSVFILHDGGLNAILLNGQSARLELQEGLRYLINPGSVGQPRDRNPQAAYLTYDSDRRIVRWHRVSYPFRKAQNRIVKAGLPAVLAERLAFGV